MVLLLTLLVLTISSTIASWLAWAGTRTRLSLFLLGGLVLASGAVVSQLFVQKTESIEQRRAEKIEERPLPAMSRLDPAASDMFVVEAVTEAGAFSTPTSFAIGDNGDLYVGDDYGVEVARDTTGNGFYDSVEHFGLDGGWVFGLHYFQDSLYASVAGSTLKLQDRDGDGIADDIFALNSGLPYDLYGGHSNSGLAVGPDGMLYMGIGGTSDHGPELAPLGGTILRQGLDDDEPEVFASGFRNPYDLAFCPDGRLYAVDNGPDQLDDNLTFQPWDEVNLIEPGRHYGYPDYFGPVPPETGTISPIGLVAPGAGITGITCYTGSAFPPEFHGDLFVTLWGTFTHPEETGRRVMRVHLEDTPDGPAGIVSDFAENFGHPIDVVENPRGSLLVLDYEYGQVFRISYVGG